MRWGIVEMLVWALTFRNCDVTSWLELDPLPDAMRAAAPLVELARRVALRLARTCCLSRAVVPATGAKLKPGPGRASWLAGAEVLGVDVLTDLLGTGATASCCVLLPETAEVRLVLALGWDCLDGAGAGVGAACEVDGRSTTGRARLGTAVAGDVTDTDAVAVEGCGDKPILRAARDCWRRALLASGVSVLCECPQKPRTPKRQNAA